MSTGEAGEAGEAGTQDPGGGHPSIVLRGVTKTFPVKGGDVAALRGVDLDVVEGEIFGLLGPNGAGKSTTLLVVTTLLKATSGAVSVAGIDVDRRPHDVRRQLGVALQETGLDPLQSGREVLELHARLCGQPRDEARRRAAELLDVVDLVDDADRRIGSYSGGMRRRIDLAVALVARPPILVLDEPTTGLDVVSRNSMWSELRRCRDGGTTILFSTQNIDEAERLADRVAFIADGRIVDVGKPDDMLARLDAPTLEDVFVSLTSGSSEGRDT